MTFSRQTLKKYDPEYWGKLSMLEILELKAKVNEGAIVDPEIIEQIESISQQVADDKITTGENVIITQNNKIGTASDLAETAVLRNQTELAKIAAESARDSTIIGSGNYPDEGTGRAAVADGQTFKVQGNGDVAAYEYRRTNSTTSVLIASYPSIAAVNKKVSNEDSPYVEYAVTDAGGFVVTAICLDGSRFPFDAAKYGRISANDLRSDIMSLIPSDDGYDHLAFSVTDSAGFVAIAYNIDGSSFNRLYRENIATNPDSSVSNVAFVNHYPNIYDKMPKSKRKILGSYPDATDNNQGVPFTEVIFGDSIPTREIHTSVQDIVPHSNPPGFTTKNIGSYMQQKIRSIEKPVWGRYDKPSVFTKTGTWSTDLSGLPLDDLGTRPTETEICSGANCSIAFSVPADKSIFNFLDRTSTVGSQSITIAISEGAGKAEVFLPGASSWVEANGAVINQREGAVTSTKGNTMYARRIYFRKIGSAIGSSLSITLTKDNTSDFFMYWGVMFANGNKPYYDPQCFGRGNHNLAQLSAYITNDILLRKPTRLVLFLPLINMFGTNGTKEYTYNWTYDFIWGDRPGNLNSNSLKNLSNNWTDFEVLIIIPHISGSMVDPDGSFRLSSSGSGFNAMDIWNTAISLIYEKGDVAMININSAWMAQADAEWDGNYYDATRGSGVSGSTLTNDNVHQNDKGTLIYAKEICPTLYPNTL